MSDSRFVRIRPSARQIDLNYLGKVTPASVLENKKHSIFQMAQVLEVSQVGRILNTSVGTKLVYIHSSHASEREASSIVKALEESAGRAEQVEIGKFVVYNASLLLAC